MQKEFSYLALGDSYTIGEMVSAEESFPAQLAASLNADSLQFASPHIVAKTGWTTDELDAGINAAQGLKQKYDLVTLLIGVNNQYRGRDTAEYRKQFTGLLQRAIKFAGNNHKHVFVLSIPDWGVTPFAAANGRNDATVAREIDIYNSINKYIAEQFGVSYTDITPHSRLAKADATLIASDGLHPSGLMYAEWVSQLKPKVLKAFQNR